MKVTSWQSWAYEADKGDLIEVLGEIGILLDRMDAKTQHRA